MFLRGESPDMDNLGRKILLLANSLTKISENFLRERVKKTPPPQLLADISFLYIFYMYKQEKPERDDFERK